MPQNKIYVPEVEELVNFVAYAMEDFPNERVWETKQKERFWEIVKSNYPDYHYHMKWYGDTDTLESQLWKIYTKGRKS